jgi:DNA-binding transcriptional LysR family regulator
VQPNRVNLNLFAALDAILNSPTLTEAAKSMHLTQSAMSTSLRKLREHFEDPLISYTRARTQLTPLGEMLRPRVSDIVRRSWDVLKLRENFDPATSRATFRLTTIDSVEIVLLPHLLRMVTESAPHVRIVSSPIDFSIAEPSLHTDVDIAFIQEGLHDPELKSEVMYSDSLIGVAWKKHTDVREVISLKQYRSLPHATIQGVFGKVYKERRKGTDVALEGVEIAVTTRSFAALAHVIVGTKLIAILPHRVAHIFAKSMPIRLFRLPFSLPETRLLAQWQDYKTSDPAVNWLLGMTRNASAQFRSDKQVTRSLQ